MGTKQLWSAITTFKDEKTLSIYTVLSLSGALMFIFNQVELNKINDDDISSWKMLILTILLLAKCIWFYTCSSLVHLWESLTDLLTCNKTPRGERKKREFSLIFSDKNHTLKSYSEPKQNKRISIKMRSCLSLASKSHNLELKPLLLKIISCDPPQTKKSILNIGKTLRQSDHGTSSSCNFLDLPLPEWTWCLTLLRCRERREEWMRAVLNFSSKKTSFKWTGI